MSISLGLSFINVFGLLVLAFLSMTSTSLFGPVFLSLFKIHMLLLGFPGGSDSKESSCSAGDQGSIPESGSSPGGGHGNPLQYSCLENPMDRGAWRATAHGVTKTWTQLSTQARME